MLKIFACLLLLSVAISSPAVQQREKYAKLIAGLTGFGKLVEPIPDDVSGAGEDQIEGEQFFEAWTDVEFQLYTRSNPTTYQVLKLNDINSIQNSNFVATRQTRYTIHGWNSNGQSSINTILRDAYLQKGDFNVIAVDWGKGANTINYETARQRIKDVSDVGAAFIDFMANQAGAPVSNIQIVGHSLGGHTSGLIGKKVKAGRIPKIVGLDPASVGFSVSSPDARLDKGKLFRRLAISWIYLQKIIPFNS